MRDTMIGWRSLAGAAAAMVMAGLVGACSEGPPQPAPVVMATARGYSGAPIGGEGAYAPTPLREPRGYAPVPLRDHRAAAELPRPAPPSRAREEYVPARVIIAANHLTPPYRLLPDGLLRIPDRREWADLERRQAGPPQRPVALTPPLPATRPLARAQEPRTQQPLPRQADVIPLDGGAPPAAAPPPIPAREKPATRDRRQESRAETPALHAGRFPWPVRGRVLADYGQAAGGGHNDGINIAAPLGTPVRAIEGGVVAYAGNQLHSYGNLILLKHPDGFISAYAHCETLLVRKGERVRPGQVIARVGATGSVREPQLHFELRRGDRAVDPHEYLAPLPSADNLSRTGRG